MMEPATITAGAALHPTVPGIWKTGMPSATITGGEVSERFKVLLSKSSVVMSHRGFESRPLRPPGVGTGRRSDHIMMEGSHSLA